MVKYPVILKGKCGALLLLPPHYSFNPSFQLFAFILSFPAFFPCPKNFYYNYFFKKGIQISIFEVLVSALFLLHLF
jgi:hypothetical protein